MGVTVLQIFPNSSQSGCPETEKLRKRIMNLDAIQSGMFFVDCETYYTIAQTGGSSRKLHIVHNGDTPATTYAILDTGTKLVTLSADSLFDFLMPRLNHMYQAKKNLRIESRGSRFMIGDFIVKIGSVTMSGHYKGILVEVEYLPCVTPVLCWSLMREFMQSFMGSCVQSNPPPYIQARFHDIHTPQDTVQQYVEKFNDFRDGLGYPSQSTTPST